MITTNLQQYKKAKKLNKVINDLATIQKLFNATLQGLATYKKYTPVREVITSIIDNKAMVDVYMKKFKKSLESYEDKLE